MITRFIVVCLSSQEPVNFGVVNAWRTAIKQLAFPLGRCCPVAALVVAIVEAAMDTGREDRIRKRAHEIWESEGRPEGREREHWDQACRDCDADAGNLSSSVGEMADGELSPGLRSD